LRKIIFLFEEITNLQIRNLFTTIEQELSSLAILKLQKMNINFDQVIDEFNSKCIERRNRLNLKHEIKIFSKILLVFTVKIVQCLSMIFIKLKFCRENVFIKQ